MLRQIQTFIHESTDGFSRSFRDAWGVVRSKGPSQLQFWFIALLVGIAAGGAAIGFRFAVNNLQSFLYGRD